MYSPLLGFYTYNSLGSITMNGREKKRILKDAPKN